MDGPRDVPPHPTLPFLLPQPLHDRLARRSDVSLEKWTVQMVAGSEPVETGAGGVQ